MQGVFIMEALWGRFCPAQQAIRALIRSGAIGEPLQGDARCAFLADFAHRRLIDPVLGGGGLLDVGTKLAGPSSYHNAIALIYCTCVLPADASVQCPVVVERGYAAANQ